MNAGEQLCAAAAEAIDPGEAARLEWAEVLEGEAARFARFSDRIPYGRLKTDEEDTYGHPVCVPLLGVGHVTVAYRRGMDCRPTVRNMMANMLVRTVADQPFGTVDITVSDHSERGAEFSRLLRALNVPDDPDTDDRYHFRPNSELSEVVMETLDYLNMRRSGHADVFGGYSSYREAVERGQQPVVPWRIVALVCRPDEQPEATTLAALDEIARYGAQYGISLICGGLGLSNGYVTQLKVLDKRWVQHAPFPVPAQAVYTYSNPGRKDIETAIADSRERQVKPGKSPDGRTYVDLVMDGLWKTAETREAMRALASQSPTEFPYLDLSFLRQWIMNGSESYAQALKTVFAPGADIRTATGIAANALSMKDKPSLVAPKLMAWAAYQLALANQHPQDRQIPRAVVEPAQEMLGRYLPHLSRLAKLILDPSSLPDTIAPYIVRQLPSEMPAWLFQLLADAAYPDNSFLPEGRFMEPIRVGAPAVTEYLARKFYPGEFKPGMIPQADHPVNIPSIRGALVELTLMELYGVWDTKTPSELCDALMWRAACRLAAVSEDDLPESARPTYRLADSYLATKPLLKVVAMTGRTA